MRCLYETPTTLAIMFNTANVARLYQRQSTYFFVEERALFKIEKVSWEWYRPLNVYVVLFYFVFFGFDLIFWIQGVCLSSSSL